MEGMKSPTRRPGSGDERSGDAEATTALSRRVEPAAVAEGEDRVRAAVTARAPGSPRRARTAGGGARGRAGPGTGCPGRANAAAGVPGRGVAVMDAAAAAEARREREP